MTPNSRFASLILVCLLACSLAHAQADSPAGGKPKTAFGAVAVGWTSLYADQGKGERANLNGWFGRPSVNLAKGYSLFADFTNYYGANKKGSVNSHGFTFGVAKQFLAKARVKPSIFVEAGDVRASNAGMIVHQFAFNAGFSLAIPINKRVDFVVTPAEYIFLYPQGDIRNDYNAKVGISFPFGHK